MKHKHRGEIMLTLPAELQHVVDRFQDWAAPREDIRAAQILGSWVRGEGDPRWSDLDIRFYTTRPLYYRRHTAWIDAIVPAWLAGADDDGRGLNRWDAWFMHWTQYTTLEGGLAVDYLIVPAWDLVWHDLTRHWRHTPTLNPDAILLDRDGRLVRSGGILLPSERRDDHARPAPDYFTWAVVEFWGAADRAVRKLGRGDLYEAHTITNVGLKKRLMLMLAWHTRTRTGWDTPIPYRYRYLETWADPRAVEAFPAIYAHYDSADVIRAMRATLDLFRWVSAETAAGLGYTIPTDRIALIDAWIAATLAEISPDQPAAH
jgi:aminoglycoside 6-adenylyltransferase